MSEEEGRRRRKKKKEKEKRKKNKKKKKKRKKKMYDDYLNVLEVRGKGGDEMKREDQAFSNVPRSKVKGSLATSTMSAPLSRRSIL